MKNTLCALLMTLAATALCGAAHAASGTLAGRMLFLQQQGNFCPTTRDCTGARYLQGEFNKNQPVKDIVIQVKNSSGAVIGTGATDSSGNFAIPWSTTSSLTNAVFRTWMKEKSSTPRFLIENLSGANWNFDSFRF